MAEDNVSLVLSAAFWEGWQAFHTRHDCKYTETDSTKRKDWADGFAVAVQEFKSGKVWWKSKTFQVGMVLAAVGIAVYFLGQSNGGSMSMSAVGGGLTGVSLLQMFLRTMTNQSVYFGNNAGGAQYY